jgi:hypothetical protein
MGFELLVHCLGIQQVSKILLLPVLSTVNINSILE